MAREQFVSSRSFAVDGGEAQTPPPRVPREPQVPDKRRVPFKLIRWYA